MEEFDDDYKALRTNGHKVKYKYEDYNKNYILTFYESQLKKFEKIGLGNDTEYGIEVTKGLIDRTKKRLNELKPVILKTKDGKWRL